MKGPPVKPREPPCRLVTRRPWILKAAVGSRGPRTAHRELCGRAYAFGRGVRLNLVRTNEFPLSTKPKPTRPAASRLNVGGSGTAGTGPGLEENVPVPAALNGPGGRVRLAAGHGAECEIRTERRKAERGDLVGFAVRWPHSFGQPGGLAKLKPGLIVTPPAFPCPGPGSGCLPHAADTRTQGQDTGRPLRKPHPASARQVRNVGAVRYTARPTP